MGTAIKHHVQHQVKPSFLIFAIQRSAVMCR